MTDEDVPLIEQERLGYVKPRFWYLAQTGETPPVRPPFAGEHKHLLLTEAEARRLLEYLHEALGTLDDDDALDAAHAVARLKKAAKRKPARRVPARRKPAKRTAVKRRGARKR